MISMYIIETKIIFLVLKHIIIKNAKFGEHTLNKYKKKIFKLILSYSWLKRFLIIYFRQ